MFIKLLFSDPRTFFAILLLISFSISMHELAHAWVALKCGDDTAARNGHLTLNPLKQMGLSSLIMLLFIGLAWGQVPVDESRMRGRFAPALVAFSGPLVNILLFALFTILSVVIAINAPEQRFAVRMIGYGAITNMVLAIFNLLPIPGSGLDGWAIVRTFRRSEGKPSELTSGVSFFLIMLLFFFSDKIFELATRNYYTFANFIIKVFTS